MREDEVEWTKIVVESEIYARDKMDHGNIEVLCQKLLAGIEIEPIEVQRVTDYIGDEAEKHEAVLLINGGHRIEAYKQYNKIVLTARKEQETSEDKVEYSDLQTKSPSVIFYKDTTLDYEESKSELLARAHAANDEQGLNNRPQDTRKAAINLAFFNPEWTQEQIGDALHRDQSTINPYVADIFRKRRATVESLIMRLSQLGWTQEMIAKKVGFTRERISQIVNNIDTNKIYNFFSQGKSVEEIANIYNLDLQTTWSLLFDAMQASGKTLTDDDRFKALNKAIDGVDLTAETFDRHKVYKSPMDLCGDAQYAGRIPGQIVLQVLYFFTNPGDRVADPMVGGGTTLDACLLMNRKCYGFDLYSHKKRRDVIPFNVCGHTKHYERKVGPLKKVDLCFLDPPYYKKKAEEYRLPDKLRTKEGFMEFGAMWVRFCNAILKDKGYVALLMSSYVDYDDHDPDECIFAHEYLELFEKEGYRLIYDGSADLSTQAYSATDVERAKESKRWLIIRRALYILRKV